MTSRDARMLVMLIEPIGSHGGMYQFDLALCYALAKHDLDLVWATCDETAPTQFSQFELWIPFRGIYGQAPAWLRGLRYARGLIRILWRALLEVKRRPVVIHQQFITVFPLELCFAALARLRGIPCVLTPHDTIPVSMKGYLSNALSLFYRQYDIVISHSKSSVPQLEMTRGDSGRVRYIPLGNLNEAIGTSTVVSRSDARSLLGLDDTASVILFWGRIRIEKGLEFLLEGLPAVSKEIPNVHLVVAGNPGRTDVGPYEQRIEDLGLRERVHVHWKYVPDEQLPAFFVAADVVALPYTHSYQSAVVMTAFAYRRPVVASAVGGLTEQIQDGRTGFLVPPRDVEMLSDALIRTLRDPMLAERMGQAGYTWAAELGDWDKIAERTVQVYHEVQEL